MYYLIETIEAYKIDRKSIDRMRMIENLFDKVQSFENKVRSFEIRSL